MSQVEERKRRKGIRIVTFSCVAAIQGISDDDIRAEIPPGWLVFN